MNIQREGQRLVSPLILLVLLATAFSLLHEGSPELTSFEILTGGILSIIYIWGAIKFLILGIKPPKALFYLLIFGLWAVLNVGLAVANGVELEWWFRRFFAAFSLPMIALVSFVEFRTFQRIRAMYVVLMLMGVIIVLVSLSELRFITINAITNLQYLRRYGGGYFSTFSLCLALPLLFHRPRFSSLQRLGLWLVVVISSLGLILSFTRTYWISTGVSLLFMVYLLGKDRRWHCTRLLWRIAIIGGLGMAVLTMLVPPYIRSFVVSRVTGIPAAFSGLSFQDRVYEAKGLFHTMLENPLTFGTGNGFGAKFTFYSVNPFSWGGVGWMSIDYSHNYYLYLLFTTGIIGLSLFLATWVKLFSSIRNFLIQTKNTAESGKFFLIGIATTVLNLLIASLTGPPLVSFTWALYFGLLVGLALNLRHLPEKASQSPSPEQVIGRTS